jgi:hypothetical protein
VSRLPIAASARASVSLFGCLFHQSDLAWTPFFREDWLERAVGAQEHEISLADGLYADAPHGVHERLEGVREIEVVVDFRDGLCAGRPVLGFKRAGARFDFVGRGDGRRDFGGRLGSSLSSATEKTAARAAVIVPFISVVLMLFMVFYRRHNGSNERQTLQKGRFYVFENHS